MKVVRVSKEDWTEKFSEKAHLIVFGEHKPAEWDRIDFALLVIRGEQIIGYATCRETDRESLYLQYGGAFPGARSTSLSLTAYIMLIDWCKQNYKRISTLVENKNHVYLKFAMKVGFDIIGLRNFRTEYGQQILLENYWECA